MNLRKDHNRFHNDVFNALARITRRTERTANASAAAAKNKLIRAAPGAALKASQSVRGYALIQSSATGTGPRPGLKHFAPQQLIERARLAHSQQRSPGRTDDRVPRVGRPACLPAANARVCLAEGCTPPQGAKDERRGSSSSSTRAVAYTLTLVPIPNI